MEEKKKTYEKPQATMLEIDKQISLAMGSLIKDQQ